MSGNGANSESGDAERKKSSPFLIAWAWVFVGVPLGWGVFHTVLQAIKLFE